MDNFMRLKGELEEAIDNYNETFATSGENESEDINALMDVVKTSVRLFSSMLCEERTMDMNEALRIGVTPEVYSLLCDPDEDNEKQFTIFDYLEE